jgi:hypothetical protein
LTGVRELDLISELITGAARAQVLITGPAGAGRSSLLRCTATDLAAQGIATVGWEPGDEMLDDPDSTLLSLLSAVVEAVPPGPGFRAVERWRERVWLNDVGPAEPGELTSGLVFASGTRRLDQHVLRADLCRLRALWPDSERAVVLIDDAERLCRNSVALERIVAAFEVSGWQLVMTGTPTCRRFLIEARSPALRSVTPIFMRAPSSDEVLRLVSDGDAYSHLLPTDEKDRVHMAFEVARLTGWLPVLVRVVGRALATEADRTGQHMEVDLRSLRVAVQLLSQFGWQGDLLRPLGRLSSAQLSRALQIVPFYRMTSRQIALCRAWGLSTDRDAIIPLVRAPGNTFAAGRRSCHNRDELWG